MKHLALSSIFVALAARCIADDSFISALRACPQSCSEVGQNPADWTVYDSVERLNSCNETLLLDFAIYSPLDDPETTVKISSCTASGPQKAKRQEIVTNSCQHSDQTDVSIELQSSGAGISVNGPHVVAAARQIQSYLKSTSDCGTFINFGYSNHSVVGVYVGASVENTNVADTLVQKFIDHIQSNGIANTTIAQYCQGANSDYTIGIAASASGDIAGIQSIVRSWSDSKCVTGLEQKSLDWAKTTLKIAGSVAVVEDKEFSISGSGQTLRASSGLVSRATCKYIKVVSGDSCGSLAGKCKITGPKFMEFNTAKNLCATLAVGQPVCCDKGTLPDLKPKPNKDGSCSSYAVIKDDYCAKIAASNGLTVQNLEAFNKNTWGWSGCNRLLTGIKICLSTGTPPMPAPVTNAVCGPQKPGSKPPDAGKSLASLNPCKLNVCCNIWGQCGTTSDFCTVSKSATGAPGTSAPGVSGCISNCGTELVKSAAPAKFISVAYFEAWNSKRKCLHMDVDQIDSKKYTHIHYSFADITKDFKVDVSGVSRDWEAFKSITDIKKILSFGGWSFSTEQDSYPIFREGVTDANRQTFATNVVNFLKQNNLDGLDFDWEYPGAPDIPGIPPGGKNDGANYLKFLQMVRAALPAGKTLSIAAPASFWYLQGFHPLDQFAKTLDYIIYMTYDLHGQWDYGNKWASPGCPAGNCLRSHVNSTETYDSLVMVTKAGVPSNKVIVGVSSYGRSFKMAQAGCTGPNCPFTGPNSGAKPGRCTETAGYIADAEIDEILKRNPSAKMWLDKSSNSNIMVYDNTEWVAYMDGPNKAGRTTYYKGLQMGGVSDWAVDLQQFAPPSKPLPELAACDARYLSLEDIERDKDKIPDHCINIYIVQAQVEALNRARRDFNDILNSGYDHKFDIYLKYLRLHVIPGFERWVLNNANEYFDCGRPFVRNCCHDCKDNACNFCSKCESGLNSGPFEQSVNCPNLIPIKGAQPTTAFNVNWHLKDKERFVKDLSEKAGIDESWFHYVDKIVDTPSKFCTDKPECHFWWRGYPVLTEPVVIPNPKKAIAEALDNLKAMNEAFDDAVIAAQVFGDMGEMAEVAMASELPVFMTEVAIDSMRQIVKFADELQEANRKEFILSFVMSFLFLVPMAGSVVAGLGLRVLGNVIIAIGETAGLAFTVYGIVQDPESAVGAILGLLVGIGGLRGNKGSMISQAAGLRRGMSTADTAKLGPYVVGRTDMLRGLQRSCGL
ncbi:hypothetical protein DRE_00961 [Drechslerella stenobrocha 248]|uniref:chitinase n=1 Tax=Drechslerella stenobrocha 248 TaxID=1043628 RepID=W7HXN9_9PEZI|nr:hypothetical protein DRE_00961 [Drechslerella stenobrocha 248]